MSSPYNDVGTVFHRIRRWAFERGILDESDASQQFVTLVEEVAFHGMRERLSGLLRDRFHRADATSNVIAATHEDIASDLGTAREVVSRLLKELEHRGAIALRRGEIELLSENDLFKSPVADSAGDWPK